MRTEAGRKRMKLFLRWHLDVSKEKVQAMSQGRAMKLICVNVKVYFESGRIWAYGKLRKYNIDEKGHWLALHHT
jgi:hypothetical protein